MEVIILEVFSARLKWLREKRGLSQKQMSEILEISQPYYFKFEKGNGQPNLETLAKLPGILGESLDFLLGLTDYDNETGEVRSSYRTHLREIQFYEIRIKRGMDQIFDIDEFINIGVINPESDEKKRIKKTMQESIKRYEAEIIEIKSQMSQDAEKLKLLLPEIPLISEKTKEFLESLK